MVIERMNTMETLRLYTILVVLAFSCGVGIEIFMARIDKAMLDNEIRRASVETRNVIQEIRKCGTKEDVNEYLKGLDIRLLGILDGRSSSRALGDAFALRWDKWLWERNSP